MVEISEAHEDGGPREFNTDDILKVREAGRDK